MGKRILLVSLIIVLFQGSIMGEVPDFSITPYNLSYGSFYFAVEYNDRSLMHDQFKVYTIAISVTPEMRKNIEQGGYISIWHDDIFVYSDTIYPTRYDDIPLPLKKKIKNEDAIIFTFDINPQYISRSWFNYSIRKNDGTVEINCLVKLKDFISLPKNQEENQVKNTPKVSESDVDFKELLEKAKQGDPQAQYELGKKYDPSECDSLENDKEMVKWYRMAAEQGHAGAQVKFGLAFLNGTVVDMSPEEAIKWFHKAAEQNSSDAQMTLGFMYELGVGIGKNYKEAFKWNMKAAKQGNPVAQEALSSMYAEGKGVIEDYVEAYKWAVLAGMQGENVKERKEWLTERMSPEQITKARELAEVFIDSSPSTLMKEKDDPSN